MESNGEGPIRTVAVGGSVMGVDACKRGWIGHGISIQDFALRTKILDVDARIRVASVKDLKVAACRAKGIARGYRVRMVWTKDALAVGEGRFEQW